MSVITSHHISSTNGDLFKRLEEAGVIHEGEIYSPRRKEYVSFHSVFDYTKADAATLKEVDEIAKEDMVFFEKSLRENVSLYGKLTDEQIAEKIADLEKCDHRLMPVARVEYRCLDDKEKEIMDGGVVWNLNYALAPDDMPAVAISRMFPEESFYYNITTEGKLDFEGIVKNGKFQENEKVFVNPKCFSYVKDEAGKNVAISIKGFQHTDGRYYNVELPVNKRRESFVTILHNITKRNLRGYAIASVRPDAEIKLTSKDGNAVTDIKSVKRFINNKNRKFTKSNAKEKENKGKEM